MFTGIGHEIDTSVADIMANRSFKTPTACAAGIADALREVIDRAEDAWIGIATVARRMLDQDNRKLARHARQVTSTVRSRLTLEQHRLDAAAERSTRSAHNALRHAATRTDVHAARLGALDPARALARGWTITRDGSGSIIRSIADVREGETLVTQLVDGSVTSTVSGTQHLEES